MGIRRESACDIYSFTCERNFVNFKHLMFIGHPDVSEQKCVFVGRSAGIMR